MHNNYDAWKTSDDRQALKTGVIEGKYLLLEDGKEIKIILTLFYITTRNGKEYHDTSNVEYFIDGEKLAFEDPILEKYETALDDKRQELIDKFVRG